MNNVEIWKDVVGYEGYYQVSNLGRLKSFVKCKKGKLLNPPPNNEGYIKTKLWKNGIFINVGVHRIVLSAFIPNVYNKPRVNHKDNNPKNNALFNLEWATHQEDINHKVRQNRQNRPKGSKNPRYGLFGEKSPNYGKHYNVGGNSAFARLVLDIQTGIFYDCVKDAATAKNLVASTLYNRLTGRRKNNTSFILLD